VKAVNTTFISSGAKRVEDRQLKLRISMNGERPYSKARSLRLNTGDRRFRQQIHVMAQLVCLVANKRH